LSEQILARLGEAKELPLPYGERIKVRGDKVVY
jgi:hypothetical protein